MRNRPKPHRDRRFTSEPLEPRLMLYNTYDGDPKWGFANGIVTYSYVNLFDGLFAPTLFNAGQIRPAIEEAMNTWATYIPLSFVERPDRIATCGGWEFAHYPPGQSDGSVLDYCIGLEHPVEG